MIITYELGSKLYINLTNRCSNSCDFCLRTAKANGFTHEEWQSDRDLGGVGSELWLDREPSVEEVIDSLSSRNLYTYEEIVFCGFGEPTERIDECVEVAKWLKAKNLKVRLNTNGQANLIHGRDVTPQMEGLFDVVSISLNNKNAKEYQQVCHSEFGEKAFDELIYFGAKCVKLGMEVVFSVVDLLPDEDIEQCRKIAENNGAKLRVREYIEQ
ncbi:MAG: TatD family nuclease-associated radical SAM protein [Clostridia bacterium]|nr:TatD family nuclease-associated radical SAM protein [Clostridia bacterium]